VYLSFSVRKRKEKKKKVSGFPKSRKKGVERALEEKSEGFRLPREENSRNSAAPVTPPYHQRGPRGEAKAAGHQASPDLNQGGKPQNT